MSSRDYIKHLVSANTAPNGARVGDEYFDPVANKLYKVLAVNGTTVTSTEIFTGINGTGGGLPTYLANSIIFANTTGYLSNTSSLQFFTSNNTLVVANAISVGTSGSASNSIYVGGRVGFANSNNISVVYQVYNANTNSLDTIFG